MATEYSIGAITTSLRGMLQALWAPKNGDNATMQAIEAIDGALAVAVQGDFRGNYPEAWYLTATSSTGEADNDILYTSPDISAYNSHLIECTAGTVDIEVSLDGTKFNTTPPAVLLHDATAVGTFSLTIASGKIGKLNLHCAKLRIRQNGAPAASCRIAHSGV